MNNAAIREGHWIAIKTAMTIVGTVESGKKVPEEFNRMNVPNFILLATNREAAKKEMCRKLDAMFDEWERES